MLFAGVCNTTKPCQNGGVCINSEDGMSYSRQCKAGVNCSLAQIEGAYMYMYMYESIIIHVHVVILVSVLTCMYMYIYTKTQDTQKESNTTQHTP